MSLHCYNANDATFGLMGFVAIDAATKERICLGEYKEYDYEDLLSRDLRCPITGGRMIPVAPYRRGPGGSFVRGHFRSQDGDDWPDHLIYDPEYFFSESVGESEFHMLGKLWIQAEAQNHFKYCLPEQAVMEKQIRIEGRNKLRIIDVAFSLAHGRIMAHEMQLAAITPKDLSQRIKDYFRAGVDCQWWLGLEAKTNENTNIHRELVGRPPLWVDVKRIEL